MRRAWPEWKFRDLRAGRRERKYAVGERRLCVQHHRLYESHDSGGFILELTRALTGAQARWPAGKADRPKPSSAFILPAVKTMQT